ncbi:hypothetical protein [Arsukibacterium sp.]|uniref:hypothetical protein n=1 Tax=Arsukibacterium sp. TaxID=1977258 RepID=UPI001BD688B0|nr:hypothetical protein [Arsukibacterium sp.]
MDKSLIFGSSPGGIYIHDSNEIYIPDYLPDQIFTTEETELKAMLISALVKCYRQGLLVNLRRHIAVSKVSGYPDKCIFEWNDEHISLAEAEVILKTDATVYYFKTSLIYNVLKYDYKPDPNIIDGVIKQFS